MRDAATRDFVRSELRDLLDLSPRWTSAKPRPPGKAKRRAKAKARAKAKRAAKAGVTKVPGAGAADR
jgi:hypothetical protein